jgi:hypothetical protein
LLPATSSGVTFFGFTPFKFSIYLAPSRRV